MENFLKAEASTVGEIRPKIMNAARGPVEHASFVRDPQCWPCPEPWAAMTRD